MAKIGIYGGTFNPPHAGHVLAAQQCREQLGLDEVILIPAAIPPHKALADDSPDAAVRLELTRLAVQGEEGLTVSAVELSRGGTSYTVDTLREIKASYHHDKLYLLMGTDMFLSFESWRNPEQIASLALPVCLHRGRENPQLKADIEQQAKRLKKLYRCEPILLDNDCVEISSTQVRRLLFFGCAQAYLPPAVLHRIEADGLYGLDADCRALPFDRLKEISLSLLKPTRVAHVAGCCETAQALARRYGADERDAARAGILHDVTKALTGEQQLQLCEHFSLDITEFEREHPKLLHAKTGAAVAERIFGENEAVCSAICYHTTGCAEMTTLEKIIYLADYIEPTRVFDGVEQLREAAWRDLDEGMLLGLDMTLEHLREQKQPQALESVQARDWLLAKGTKA